MAPSPDMIWQPSLFDVGDTQCRRGVRMSIAFRHGLDPAIYDNAEATPAEDP